MNDPGGENKDKETPSDEPQQTGSFFYGGSFVKEIGFVILAGFIYAAYQSGYDMMDRLAKWIDGELDTPAIESTQENPAQILVPITDGSVPEIATPEIPNLPEAGVIDGDVITVAGFKLNLHESWLVEPMPGLMRPHKYFGHLMDPTLESSGNDSAFLLGIPESYLIEMPDDVGQIILLRKHVLLNKKPSHKELLIALEKQGTDGVAIVSRSSNGRVAPLTFDESKPFVFIGSVDPATISENDLFDHYFLAQLSTMSSLRLTHGSIDLRYLRRRSVEGYEIGEIDYIIGPGTLRLSAVFYWHLEEGAQWGEFGLFLALRKEPVLSKHQEMFETVSSLRILNGEREIWRGLDFDAPADDNIGSFVHVEVDAARLRMRGLDVDQLDRKIKEQLPVSATEIEDIVVRMHGEEPVYLRDVANLDQYKLGNDDMFRTPESIVLTVTQ